ncbi:ABC transporter permease [Thermotoga profunda]|uniref:ABC transporter permease n=1 Tax=Thermotoga profunda TaxID=1508420 RepID=UPI0005972F94|nr:ABC transporter permease [Thermotoga profunda]
MKNSPISRIFSNRFAFSLIILVLFIIFSGIIQPNYFDPRHIFTVIQQAAPLIVAALGQIFVVFTGGIDLSVGSILIFTDVFAASLMMGTNERTIYAVMVSLIVGSAFGFVNGIGVELLNLPPLVMTLASSIGVQGLMYLWCRGFPRGGASPILRYIGTARWGIIPVSILIWGIAVLISALLAQRTRLGWSLKFLGSNRKAAHAMGISCKFAGVTAYVLSGMFASLAGILILGYVGIPSLVLGDDYTMASIAAAVLGGVSLSGGVGSVLGAVTGGLLMRYILALLTAFNVSAGGKYIVEGIVIFTMIAMLTFREKEGGV